jgi:hypothetical protein
MNRALLLRCDFFGILMNIVQQQQMFVLALVVPCLLYRFLGILKEIQIVLHLPRVLHLLLPHHHFQHLQIYLRGKNFI